MTKQWPHGPATHIEVTYRRCDKPFIYSYVSRKDALEEYERLRACGSVVDIRITGLKT